MVFLDHMRFLMIGHSREWDITCTDMEPAIIGLPPFYPFLDKC
jgi:hypothetical protein